MSPTKGGERPRELWGTFAVNDHCRRHAFVREVLAFDRLVLPKPADAKERTRWQKPDPSNPLLTWNPDGLDELLDVLGTQKRRGHRGAQCAWVVKWSESQWQHERSRLEAARVVTDDAYWTTRRILAQNDTLPAVVEAVAAYPSKDAWEADLRPSKVRSSAGSAIIQFARPLLLPNLDTDSDRPLRQAIELAVDADFRKARAAYHEWVRDFVAPLQAPGETEFDLDSASAELARQRLDDLVSDEQRAARRSSTAKLWRMTEWVLAAVGASVGAVAAFHGHPIIGATGSFVGFGGFVAGKMAPASDRGALSGATMFVAAERHIERRRFPLLRR
jgi:hypothetical protein